MMRKDFELDELRRASDLAGLPNWAMIIIDKAVDELSGRNLSAPLFTRTVYSVAELHAQIDAIEALGFTNYVVGRDEQTLQFYTNSTTIVEPPTRSRWIIKVYGEVTE